MRIINEMGQDILFLILIFVKIWLNYKLIFQYNIKKLINIK